MQASGAVTQDIEFKALEGSLSMMSKGASRSPYSFNDADNHLVCVQC